MGVFYGFSHQRTITATQRAAHAKNEYEGKQKLIDQAKAEYARKTAAASSATTKDDGTIDEKCRRPLWMSAETSGVTAGTSC